MSKQNIFIFISKIGATLYEWEGVHFYKKGNFRFTSQQQLQQKEELTNWLKDQVKASELNECIVSWCHPKVTLIPQSIFEQDNKELLFKSSFVEPLHGSEIDYNRLMAEQLIVLYEIPLWVKSIFVSFFPRSIVQHHLTHMLRGGFNHALLPNMQVQHIGEQVFIQCFKNGQLQFSNSFEAASTEDLVYYISYVFQQEEMSSTSKIHLFSSEAETIQLHTLHTELKSLKPFQSCNFVLDEAYTLKHLSLCV